VKRSSLFLFVPRKAGSHSARADGLYVMNVRIHIDRNCCTGCKMCVKSCRYGVLEWLDDGPIAANPY
jgi:ferredoxin